MKRQVDKTGGKLWFNENLIEGFQDQLYKAIESYYKPYGSCIISGCGVSGSNIAEGIVYLDGKIMPFAGASGLSFPKYLKSQMTPVTAAYDDGHSDTTEEIYEAILSSTIPSGEYITISAQGGKTFRQAFQDANNRMVSDAKINEWNASRGNAVSDVRGGVATSQNTLKKLYDWATELFDEKIDRTVMSSSISSSAINYVATLKGVRDAKNYAVGAASTDATNKADSARSDAVSDIRNGVSTEQNTLKKMYDWAIGLFNTKVDKSVMSSNISSASITNVATSKAVNDAKENARSNAVNDVRGSVGVTWNTLKKLYDHFTGLIGNVVFKDGVGGERFAYMHNRDNAINLDDAPVGYVYGNKQGFLGGYGQTMTFSSPDFGENAASYSPIIQISAQDGAGIAWRAGNDQGIPSWTAWNRILDSENSNRLDKDWSAKNLSVAENVTVNDVIIR